MTQNSESRTTPANELTAEQQSTLEKLHSNEAAILLRFDQVLAEFGIDRHVHQFTTVRERTREIKDLQFVDFLETPGWCCCVISPPDEAPCELCPKPGETDPVELAAE